jgi:hypothetical protein
MKGGLAMEISSDPLGPASSTSLLPTEVRDAFWAVVRVCLKEFHGKLEEEAIALSDELRSRIEIQQPRNEDSLIYHNEPFYVACGLAGIESIADEERLFDKCDDEYRAILRQHQW